MYVSRVVYSRLVNTGNYENERFEVEAVINEGESPEAAFAQVELIVNAQVANRLNDLDARRNVDEDEIPY